MSQENSQTNTPAPKNSKQKRSTSQEFLRGYNDLWKEGPKIAYQNPDNWYPRNENQTQQSF